MTIIFMKSKFNSKQTFQNIFDLLLIANSHFLFLTVIILFIIVPGSPAEFGRILGGPGT